MAYKVKTPDEKVSVIDADGFFIADGTLVLFQEATIKATDLGLDVKLTEKFNVTPRRTYNVASFNKDEWINVYEVTNEMKEH